MDGHLGQAGGAGEGGTNGGALDDPATLRAFAHRVREGLYVADADGRLLDANPALVALAGAPDVAALRGRSLDDFVTDAPRRRDALRGLSPDGGARDVDVELVGLDGRRHAAVESVVAVRDARGETRLQGIVIPLPHVGRTHAPDAAAAERAASAAASAREARDAAGRDGLTGCLDRTHLNALAARLSRDAMTQVGVVVVRLEARAEGEAMRDELRQLTARFLMRHVRGNEPVVRLGDDEFLVVLGGANGEQVERVARRVQLLAVRGAPGALSLGWAARQRGESLPAIVARATASYVPVPLGAFSDEDRRQADEHAGLAGAS